MEEERAETRLYDLFIMGLTWLRQDKPETLARRGASIFASLQYSDRGFAQAQQLATMSWDLAELTREHSVVYEGERAPRKAELQRLIAESDKHNVILAVPTADMTPVLYFGPSGYSHAITEAGLAYAARITDRYAPIITREDFLHGWEVQRVRMMSFNAKRDAERDKQ